MSIPGTSERRGSDAVSREETMLRRVQVSQMQAQVDVREQLGQYGSRMHQMSHKRLSSQTGESGTQFLLYRERYYDREKQKKKKFKSNVHQNLRSRTIFVFLYERKFTTPHFIPGRIDSSTAKISIMMLQYSVLNFIKLQRSNRLKRCPVTL